MNVFDVKGFWTYKCMWKHTGGLSYKCVYIRVFLRAVCVLLAFSKCTNCIISINGFGSRAETVQRIAYQCVLLGAIYGFFFYHVIIDKRI